LLSVVALYSSNTTLSNNYVKGNAAHHGHGGSILLHDSAATLSDNTVTGNTARYGGGGVGLDSSDATLDSNMISANTADWGGGLYLASSDAKLRGNIVATNTANNGGGVCLNWYTTAALVNNVVAENWAHDLGGGLYVRRSSPQLIHSTFASNGAGDGSGIHVTDDSTVPLTNTIIVSHTVGITVAASSAITLERTLWYGNQQDTGGDGTIITTGDVYGDPAFANPDTGDYHLSSASAGIEGGIDAGVTDDIDGDPRPYGCGVDIGADEYVGPRAPSTGTFEPNGGSGRAGQWIAFTTTYGDCDGYKDITWAFFFLDREPPIASGGLAAAYYRPANILLLLGGGACRPGQLRSLNTPYVMLDCQNSSVSGTGDTLTVNWHMRPEQCFEGGCSWNYAVEFVADSTGLRDAGLVGWWRLGPATAQAPNERLPATPTKADMEQLRREIATWQSELGNLD